MKKESKLNLETPCEKPQHVVNVSNCTATVSVPSPNEYTARAVEAIAAAAKENAEALKHLSFALNGGRHDNLIGMKIDCGSKE